MNRRTKQIAASLAAVAAIGIGAGAAAAGGKDTGDGSKITGEALRRASAAALAHTGGGRVTDTELRDEASYYEVEVALPNGREVDVKLDQNFKVVEGASD